MNHYEQEFILVYLMKPLSMCIVILIILTLYVMNIFSTLESVMMNYKVYCVLKLT